MFTRAASMIPSQLGRRLLNGAAWSVLGTVFAQVLLMGATAMISRILPKSEFGAYMLVQTTVNTLGIVAGFGLGTLVTRYAAALKEQDKPRLARILTLGKLMVLSFGTLSALGMLVLSGIVATTLFRDPALANLFRLSCGALLFSTIDNYQKSVLIGFEKLRSVAMVSISSALLSAVASVVLAFYFGTQGAALALTISGLIQSAFSYVALGKLLEAQKLHTRCQDWRSETPLIVNFAVPALIANLLVPGALWVSQALLGRAHDGYAELALYGIAMQWFNALLFIPNIASKVLTPLLAELAEKKAINDLSKVVKMALGTNLILTTGLVVVFVALSGVILNAYGQHYPKGHQVLAMIGGAAILASLMNVPGNLLSAHSQMWLGSLMNFGWASIYVVGSAVLISYGWGASGLAASLVAAYFAHLIWSSVWLVRKMRAGRAS